MNGSAYTYTAAGYIIISCILLFAVYILPKFFKRQYVTTSASCEGFERTGYALKRQP